MGTKGKMNEEEIKSVLGEGKRDLWGPGAGSVKNPEMCGDHLHARLCGTLLVGVISRTKSWSSIILPIQELAST